MTLDSLNKLANIIMAVANVLLVGLGCFAALTYIQDVRRQRGSQRRFVATLYRAINDLSVRHRLMMDRPVTTAEAAVVLGSPDALHAFLAKLSTSLDALLGEAHLLHPASAAHLQVALFDCDLTMAALSIQIANPSRPVPQEIFLRLEHLDAALHNAIRGFPGAKEDAELGRDPAHQFTEALALASSEAAKHRRLGTGPVSAA